MNGDGRPGRQTGPEQASRGDADDRAPHLPRLGHVLSGQVLRSTSFSMRKMSACSTRRACSRPLQREDRVTGTLRRDNRMDSDAKTVTPFRTEDYRSPWKPRNSMDLHPQEAARCAWAAGLLAGARPCRRTPMRIGSHVAFQALDRRRGVSTMHREA